MLVLSFDAVVARSDPKGLLVRFDISASQPIKRIELYLDGDGQAPFGITPDVGVGMDGRYMRALAFKPTVNGTFPLVIRAIDKQNRVGVTTCTPGVTVTY